MRKMILNKYETIIFDCDGVILNSNIIKTEGFFEFALSLGKKNAEKLVNYHIKNGGISRYEKIKYFYKKILNEEINEEKLNFETNRYSKIIQKKLMKCSVAPFIENLKLITPNSNWVVVSGSDQKELREIFKARDLSKNFDDNIFGSPRDKKQIIIRGIKENIIKFPAIFIGDSEYDYKTAKTFEFDFIYLSEWSEWMPQKKYQLKNIFKNIQELYQHQITNKKI